MPSQDDFQRVSEDVNKNSRNIEVLVTKIDLKLENLDLKLQNLVNDNSRVSNEISKMRDDVHDISNRLTKTETELRVLESQELHPRVTKLESRFWWVMGAIAASGTIGGGAAAIIGWLLQYFLGH